MSRGTPAARTTGTDRTDRTTGTVRTDRTARPPRPARRGRRAGPLFVAPYLLFLIAFGLLPVGYGLWTTFVVSDPYGGERTGTDNWTRVASDYRLGPAVEHIALYLAIWLPLLLLTVVSLSLLLHARKGRFAGVMRLAYYLPGAVTGSAAAMMWIFMISPQYSPVAPLLRALGFDSSAELLGGPWLPVVLSAVAVEAGAGGWIVILYGALQSIPDEVIEAARMDGANGWQQAVHIKLPIVRKYLAFILITSFAGGTQLFVEPQLLSLVSKGVISATWSPNQLAYVYASGELSFGRASVLSVLLLAVGLGAALVVIYRTKFYETDARR
ncbi:carbohydrate ABC transporter permease [Kitasatospora purpeofusca]|uniref:carbohydrate ABC transporter permease n=1 Tax=Kitasatospora purpeofusca TaxID=67352 RepID=UPI003F4AF586